MRTIALLTAAVILSATGGSASANLIFNGDFGLGDVAYSTGYLYAGNLSSPQVLVVGTDPHDHAAGAASYGDHTSGSGYMLIVNGATTANVTIWQQQALVEPDTDYVVSYWLSSWSPGQPARIKCLINGNEIGSSLAPAGTGEWVGASHTWNSGSASEATLRLVDGTLSSAGNDFAIDDIGMISLAAGEHFLQVSCGPGGSIVFPGTGTFAYPHGENVLIEARPNRGYEFKEWSGDFYSTEALLILEMDMDRSVTASFARLKDYAQVYACGRLMEDFERCTVQPRSYADAVSTMLDSEYEGGLLLGDRGVSEVTYGLPLFKPPAGLAGIEKIIVTVEGHDASADPKITIGALDPQRTSNGRLVRTFTGTQINDDLLKEDGLVYRLSLRIAIPYGEYDVSGIHVAYRSPDLPLKLLQCFHDHFAACEAIQAYTADSALRAMWRRDGDFNLVWEAMRHTLARARNASSCEGGPFNALQAAVDAHSAIWQKQGATAMARANVTALPMGYDGPGEGTVMHRLRVAGLSGEAYVARLAAALADGRLSTAEATELDAAYIEPWRTDLRDLQSTLNEAYAAWKRVYTNPCPATCPANPDDWSEYDRTMRRYAQQMIYALSPWVIAELNAKSTWVRKPGYLDALIESVADLSVPPASPTK